MQEVTWCSNCLNMSTRPRIKFDHRGWCNACQWMERKKTLDWSKREKELVDLLAKYKSKNGGFDCLVPVSGGKDGSYVAYRLKHDYGMNVLALTISPALPLDIGEENLKNFVKSGFNHISVNPNQEAMREFNRMGFIEMGFPYYGWLVGIHSCVVSIAAKFNIPLIFYGEDGEVEYGGSTETSERPGYDVGYMKRIYLEGGYDKVLNKLNVNQGELEFWRFPSDEECKDKEIFITHWSYFENWDPYRNYLIAKEHCGLKENTDSNSGTFTNFAQNDQALYALHTYLMYLKFGFGRATQDAGIEIRRGAMTRDQGVNLVRVYDNCYPEQFESLYLDYYRLTKDEFDAVLDRYANKNLFEKINGRWEPKFEVS